MQHFSFDFGDRSVALPAPLADWRAALQIVTFENIYGLDPAQLTTRAEAGAVEVEADRLMWAGGQELADGRGRLRITPSGPGAVEIRASAGHTRTIRCTKVVLGGLPVGSVLGARWRELPLPPTGAILTYPGSLHYEPELGRLHTALIFIRVGDDYIFARSLDDRVRQKRFALARDPADPAHLTLELIHEDAAPEMGVTSEPPAWEVGYTRDPEAVVRRHAAHVERAFGLSDWASRADVPGWAREIALVLTLHGMHWSGFVFNSYDAMLAAIAWAAERIEGRRILAYLPGWEGRYYWQYGEFRPDPRLGGPEGFRRLADGARRLGARLLPMFGANSVNKSTVNYERWGEPSQLRTAGGWIFQGNKPDWDASRAHDPGWHAWLNPGAPGWQAHLAEQVSRLVREYDLSAAFFDTDHYWLNDPSYPVWEGLRDLYDGLRAAHRDFLVVGEGWYDALGAIRPVCHAGTPEQWSAPFEGAGRTFGHLFWGDPGRGSTGVHERGYAPFRPAPLGQGWWPTLPIVDGTLAVGAPAAEQVIAQARAYASRFLAG